jgi:hypothetical protein
MGTKNKADSISIQPTRTICGKGTTVQIGIKQSAHIILGKEHK